MKREIIKVGDTVKIINPLFVKRVGYDFTFEDALKEVEKKFGRDIHQLLKIVKPARITFTENKITQAVAFDLVKRSFSDNNERKIFTELKEFYKDLKVKVIGKKVVRTGFYQTSYYDAECSDSYEGATLLNPKTHILLELDSATNFYNEPMRIEVTNVEKINN